MPRLVGSSKGKTGRLTVRLDKPTEDFYRKKAQEAGIPVAEYCRQLLMRGVVNDNVQQLEKRLEALLAAMPGFAGNSGSSPTAVAGKSVALLPADLVRAIFFSREVLTSIVSDRNIQFFHQAQDRAEAAAKKLLGDAHV